MDQDAAAAKLQAVKRGRDGRVAVAKQKQEENSAATKLAAAKRGKDSRALVQAKREEAAAKKAAVEAAAEAEASARLGACAKGYVQRKKEKQEKQEKEEMKGATTRIQASFRGRKERKDPNAESNVRKARAANDPSLQAEKYIKDHKLMQLFELLGETLVRAKPDNPRTFLVQYLTQLKEQDNPTSPLHFFEGDDVDTLFSMYDVSNRGLTPAQCREALNAIGLERVQVPVVDSERFDKAAFMELVNAGA